MPWKRGKRNHKKPKAQEHRRIFVFVLYRGYAPSCFQSKHLYRTLPRIVTVCPGTETPVLRGVLLLILHFQTFAEIFQFIVDLAVVMHRFGTRRGKTKELREAFIFTINGFFSLPRPLLS